MTERRAPMSLHKDLMIYDILQHWLVSLLCNSPLAGGSVSLLLPPTLHDVLLPTVSTGGLGSPRMETPWSLSNRPHVTQQSLHKSLGPRRQNFLTDVGHQPFLSNQAENGKGGFPEGGQVSLEEKADTRAGKTVSVPSKTLWE